MDYISEPSNAGKRNVLKKKNKYLIFVIFFFIFFLTWI